jgi:hypothetical protein
MTYPRAAIGAFIFGGLAGLATVWKEGDGGPWDKLLQGIGTGAALGIGVAVAVVLGMLEYRINRKLHARDRRRGRPPSASRPPDATE